MRKRKRINTPEELHNTWTSIMDPAIDMILQKRTETLVYQDLFNIFHSSTLSSLGDSVHSLLQISLKRVLVDMDNNSKLVSTSFLASFVRLYGDYYDLVDKISKIAIYYDRKFAAPAGGSKSTPVVGGFQFLGYFQEVGRFN